MRIGIRSKLVTILIIAGVIPLLIAIAITYFVGSSQRKETVGEKFQQLSEKACENIVLRLSASIRVIRDISVLPLTIEFLNSASADSSRLSRERLVKQIADLDKRWHEINEQEQPLKDILDNPLAKTLKAFRSVESTFGEIFATDTSGQLVASTNKTTDYWQADEEWWQNAYDSGKGRFYLSGVSFDESSGIYSTDICIPVKISENNEERVVGIVKGVLNITRISESILDIDVGRGSKAILVSDSGTVLHSRDLTPLQERVPLEMLPRSSMGSSGWFVATVPDGPDALVGFARIAQSPWLVIVSQQLNHAFAPIHKLVWYISLPGVGLIMVFFFIGLFLVERKVVSPLSLLTQTERHVAGGDLARRVQIDSKDEIGVLAASFNQMVSNLEKRTSLDNISMNMLSHLELSDVLSMTMETLTTTFDAAFGRVWLVGNGDLCDVCVHESICPNKNLCLHLKVTVGIYAKDEDYLRVPIGGLKVGWIAETRKPFMSNNIASDNQIHNLEFFQKEGLVSFAGYPLLIGDELLGVLALSSRKIISDEDFAILGSFVNRTAMAIQNAKLHSEILELNLNLEKKVEERTQELKMTNVKLKKADQMKSEFLANMSHELRTPLNAIIGFAEVLRDGLVGGLNEDQKASVIDIHGSGKHLLQMINDILDLSKVEAGKMVLQPEEFSLAAAIDDIHSIVRDMVNKKHLILQTNIPDDLPYIHADSVKFKQIMYNLLSNAVKFTPEGGSVTIDASLKDDVFLISVTDTGIGIEPANHETIFDEFKQLDSSRSRQYEGTGLGLSLTKKLVELHEGRIWVESEGLGKGSRFSFTLPAVQRDHEVIQRVSDRYASAFHAPDRSPKKVILVVEDNSQASQLLCIYLSEAGYDTVVATNGDEAIEMARKVKPFAITLDIMLPKKDGWQVMQELKSFKDTSNIPVIIISVVDDQTFGFNMGAVGYLVKPIDKLQLTYTLKKLESVSRSKDTTTLIMIIDDNSEDLRFMETVFRSEGFDVLMTTNGSDGLVKAVEKHPDLIILDLLMPGMSGFDVVKSLQEHEDTRDIPIVICTLKELTAEDREMLNSKVSSIVQKGEDAKTHLLEAVRKIEQFHLD